MTRFCDEWHPKNDLKLIEFNRWLTRAGGRICMIRSAYPKLRRQIWSTLIFALPIIGSNLAQSAKHLTDTVMLGRYGVDELAAGVLAGVIFMITFIVGSGFAQAAIPMAAEARGAGLTWKVRRVIRMSFWLSCAYGLILVPPLFQTERFLLLLGQQEDIARLAGDYMDIALWGIFPALSVMVLKSFFVALAMPRLILWATVFGALLNIPANYAFIFGNWGAPELGIQGAAVATVAAHSAGLLILLVFSFTNANCRSYSLYSRFWRPEWQTLLAVFRIGWPISITLIAETGLFAVCSIMMGWISTEALAAHGIALEAAAFVFMMYLGVSIAVTTQVGFTVGQRDRDAIVLMIQAATAVTFILAIMVVVVFVSIPELIVSAFLDESAEKAAVVLSIGITLMYLGAAFQIGDALQVVALGILRGFSDTKVPMLIAAFSYAVVGAPISYLLGFIAGWGSVGVWCGFIIGLGMAALLLFLRIRILLSQLDF